MILHMDICDKCVTEKQSGKTFTKHWIYGTEEVMFCSFAI